MSERDDSEAILRQWVAAGFDAAALDALSAKLPASQLWSLLLGVMQRRATQRTLAALQQQWTRDRFVAPASIDQRALLAIDRELFTAAVQFEAIELSPLAPLGACSVVAPTSQNRVVATTRGTEVVADPTSVLALESAQRLRKDPTLTVKFATSHRCVRAQEVPNRPGFAAHFRMFCMTTAGHEIKDQGFVVTALAEHIETHLHGLDRLETIGYRFPGRVVRLLATSSRTVLAQRIGERLHNVAVEHAPLQQPYYDGLRFMINAGSAPGEAIPLIDGGAFDWVGKLASNRKLAFVASAIGSQLVAYLYRSVTR